MQPLNRQIRTRREALGLSQEELGQRVGVSTQAVQAWEYGRAQPRPKKMERLAEALETTEAELRGLASNPSPLSLDVERLELVSEQVQQVLDEYGVEVSPRQRARLMALLYEEQDWVTAERLPALLRLVS